MPTPGGHHTPRPRLTSKLRHGHIGLIWGAGGYGKSALASEFAQSLGVTPIEIRVSPEDRDPGRFTGRLRRALSRAGAGQLLAPMEEELDDPAAALSALSDALEREPEPILIVVDEVQHCAGQTARLLSELALELTSHHRLLLVGRTLPPELRRLEDLGGAVTLNSSDLAFTPQEVIELAAQRARVALTEDEAQSLHRSTSGWAAALVVALGTLMKSRERPSALSEITSAAGVLAQLLRELLDSLDEVRRAGMVELGHVPLISPAIAAAVTNGAVPDLFADALSAGFPLTPGRDGWWELPGPVSEFLARLGPLSSSSALAVADAYMRSDELHAALSLLLSTGQTTRMAELLAGLEPKLADRLDHVELGAFVAALPSAVLAGHPRVLLHLARACEAAALVRVRATTLERARTLAEELGDPVLVREVKVELARDCARDGLTEDAARLAGEAIEQAGEGELVTRARGLTVLGQVAAWERTDHGLAQAEYLLEQALVLCRTLGSLGWEAQVLLPLAISVHHVRGEFEQALTRLDEYLQQTQRSRHRCVVLTFRADILTDLGRYSEARTNLDEAAQMAQLLHDQRTKAYVAWSRAKIASQLMHRHEVVALVAEAEQHAGDWFRHSTGAEFLAEAAELLDRVGEAELARQALHRAEEREQATDVVRAAGAALLARRGDAKKARKLLDEVSHLPRRIPRERWRHWLLCAYAALREDDRSAGRLAAAAFDAAEDLGVPALPIIREREIATVLAPLAAAAGSRAAAELLEAELAVTISMLGEFSISRSGQPVRISPGRPDALVKLVAIRGGRISAYEAAGHLWPEADPEIALKRLRNVLSRTELVVQRRGEFLVLPENAEIDVVSFEQEAREVLRDRRRPIDAELARRALARYRDELLPGERPDWIVEARERLNRLFVDLLDALAEDSEAREDYEEALALLARAAGADPYDERRYLLIAGLQAQLGRRAEALRALEAGRRALAQLEVSAPAAYEKLEARLRR